MGASGTLRGHGTITGDVDNTAGGTVEPGASVGTLTIDGDYTQGSDSTLDIEVTSEATSHLVVSGTATLAGTLVINYEDGTYYGDDYDLITAGSISGSFDTVSITGADDNTLYSLTEDSTTVTLSTISSEAGQIYSDLTTTMIDNAHVVNGMMMDHDAGDDDYGMNVWGRAFGGAGSHDSHHSDSNPFNQRWAGVLMGADYLTTDNISYGFSLAYHQAALSVQNTGKRGHGLTNSFTVAFRGSTPVPGLDKARLSGDVYYMANDVTVHRLASNAGPTAHPDSKIYGGALQMTYAYGDFTPRIRLGYLHVKRDATTETGSGSNLAIASRSYDSFRSNFTVQYKHSFDLEDGMRLTPDARVGVEVEMTSSSNAAKVKLTGSADSWVVPDYAKPDTATAVMGLGATLNVGPDTAFYIRADGNAGSNSRNGMLSIGGRFTF